MEIAHCQLDSAVCGKPSQTILRIVEEVAILNEIVASDGSEIVS